MFNYLPAQRRHAEEWEAAARSMLAVLEYSQQLYAEGILKENADPWHGTLKRMTDSAVAQAKVAGIRSEGERTSSMLELARWAWLEARYQRYINRQGGRHRVSRREWYWTRGGQPAYHVYFPR